jgi:hypothetical protein
LSKASVKLFTFQRDTLLLGALMWVVWLPAQWVTSAYISRAGCEIEMVPVIRWLCGIFGVFAIDVITPVMRIGVVATVLIGGAFLQGVFGNHPRARWDLPLVLLGVTIACLNSVYDYSVWSGLGRFSLMAIFAGVPIAITATAITYYRYIIGLRKSAGGGSNGHPQLIHQTTLTPRAPTPSRQPLMANPVTRSGSIKLPHQSAVPITDPPSKQTRR